MGHAARCTTPRSTARRRSTPTRSPRRGSRPRSSGRERRVPPGIRTEAGPGFGGFGAILALSQASPGADRGTLRLVFRCDPGHTGLDNVAFWDADHVVFVEDAGDGLHNQRNALDSQQHSDNTTWEILPRPSNDRDDD